MLPYFERGPKSDEELPGGQMMHAAVDIEIDSEAQRETLSPGPFHHLERNSRLQLLSHHLKTGLLKPQH
jgi:hypothetical protein